MSHHYSVQYANLEQEALLHITGPDALSFLQGQVTCDTRKLGAQCVLPGLYCTPQGRVIGDFLLCQLAPDHLVLRLRSGIRAACTAALSKYIVFSKATLEAECDDWQVLACWGKDASAALETVFGVAPQSKYDACASDHFLLLQLDELGQQFECYVNRNQGAELLERMHTNLRPSTQVAWQALQVASGVGRIEPQTSAEFIPQMLNYDLTGYISFNKGCYTGQEVVARMHYRGKSKRRLYLGSLSAEETPPDGAPEAGTRVYSNSKEQSVGAIVNSAVSSDDQILVLVTATAEGVTEGLRLGSQQGPLLALGELPYSETEG